MSTTTIFYQEVVLSRFVDDMIFGIIIGIVLAFILTALKGRSGKINRM